MATDVLFRRKLNLNLPFTNRVTLKERAFFARQIATMLSSGIQLTQALNIFNLQLRNHYFKQALEELLKDLEEGKTFSQAAARHPRIFNELFVSVIQSGEASGKLDNVLLELSRQLEEEQDFVSKIRGAMTYPAFIIVVMIVIGGIVFIKVIPQLSQIFKESNVALPWTTALLIGISEFLVKYWYILIFGILVAIFVLRFVINTEEGRLYWHRLLISDPLHLGKDIYMTRFTRTLSMLVSSGVPIIRAVEITSNVLNNKIYQQALDVVTEELERGIPMSQPLSENPDFPALIPQMILVGEQTGKLDQILDKLASYYENETNIKIQTLSSLLEPMIIVIIGIGVGFMVFSILVPIYNIAQFQ